MTSCSIYLVMTDRGLCVTQWLPWSGGRGHDTEASRKEREGDGWSSTWVLKSPWTMVGVEVERKSRNGVTNLSINT